MTEQAPAAPLIEPTSPHSDHKDYTGPHGGVIAFQKGAMELGRNGWTTEELLNVLIEHIGGFQKGAFACEENALVLGHLDGAKFWVDLRAARRTLQGSKGREAAHKGASAEFEPIMQFFESGHLPVLLQSVSLPFCILARGIVELMPRSPERSTALRKLLESKDAAVRASIYKPFTKASEPVKVGPC